MRHKDEFLHRFLWLASFCVVMIFLVLNIFTPLIADDYSLSAGINSVSDIIKLTYRDYFLWTGRSLGFFFSRLWLFLGKPAFNIANTIVYFFFIYFTQYHIVGKLEKTNPALFLLTNIFFWFFVPAWGQNFLWLTGSCNYLWTTTIILLFLVPFRKKYESEDYKMNIPFSVLFFCAWHTGGMGQ